MPWVVIPLTCRAPNSFARGAIPPSFPPKIEKPIATRCNRLQPVQRTSHCFCMHFSHDCVTMQAHASTQWLPSSPPLARAKAFSRLGRGRIFLLFRGLCGELKAEPGAGWLGSGLSRPIFGGPHVQRAGDSGRNGDLNRRYLRFPEGSRKRLRSWKKRADPSSSARSS